MDNTLSDDLLSKMGADWRESNCLTLGRIYPQDNALLEATLKPAHIKPRLLGIGAPPPA